MINLQRTVLFFFVTQLVACGAPSTTQHNCPGDNPSVKPINIKYKDPKTVNNPRIEVVPRKQTADEGDVLQFNLVGPNEIEVSTSGKKFEGKWLKGSGEKGKHGGNDKFYVCVPTDLFDKEPDSVKEKDFGYNVNADGHPELDPIVRVIRDH